MEPLAGRLALLAADPPTTGLFCDFDGTLAPIVDDPEAARPCPGVAEVLAGLSRRWAVVAVVSGRPAAFLAEHLADAGPAVHLVGLYGLQWIEDGVVRVAPEAEPWIGVVSKLVERARDEAPAGVLVEAKGVSLVLHWRTAPGQGPWCRDAGSRWAASSGLVAQPGRMSVELRPPIAADKGTAVERLARGCRVVGFAGDDTGDLAAFDALDRLAGAGTVQVVKVAVADTESPSALIERADVVLAGPEAMVDGLRTLLASGPGADPGVGATAG